MHECTSGSFALVCSLERFTGAACYWSNVLLDKEVIWEGQGILKVLNARMSAVYSDSCLRDNRIKPRYYRLQNSRVFSQNQ